MNVYSEPSLDDTDRKRIATIYQRQSRSTQDTPKLDYGDLWTYQHEPVQMFKSPLMHWGTATEDPYAQHSHQYRNLEEAIQSAKLQGHGFDVQLPRFRYHLRKAYIDNFKWKGKPQPNDEHEDTIADPPEKKDKQQGE